MTTGNHPPKFGSGLFFSALLLFAFLLNACQGDPVKIPDEDVFTKAKREQLGKLLLNEVLANYQLLPKISPYDTSVYWYVQRLFTQATNVMQADKKSPSDNRWTGGWEVFIIKEEQLSHAFMLPGGPFFITTGMLKEFEKESELYFLLTFEAALMHEGHLLNLLKQQYNSLTLINLIEGRATASGVTIADVAADLPNLKFDKAVVKGIDGVTVGSICGTSILSPTSIVNPLLRPGFQSCKWMTTRPGSSDRAGAIQGHASNHAGDCGGNLGGENYRRFVLNILD